ncbi:uncharacterized protein LOC102706425 [Oryza brachyantha]|uniref:uncharacterized protein LOC102706425 n=1 Tax=Oryza brachyantha TaxID=4533 RepID=UPI001ADBD956|nr:uncharacterized protein LOC102706425 [Oryza brachyantha]
MKWFGEIKFPDGYAANIRRGVNMEQLKIHGLKSHDYHIFMERLLPVMIRGFVDRDVWEVLAELSYFYRRLCAKEIDPAQMLQLEASIPVIICKLEKIFSPGFFNSMEHLMVHLPYQAMVGGPVKYHWMYLVESFIKTLKRKVGNKARVEGSIAESYLVEEISHFTSLYLPELIASTRNRPQCYAQNGVACGSSLSLFQVRGWKFGRGMSRTLTNEEYKTVMIYIFSNMTEMDSLIEKFESEQWRRARPPNQKELDNLRRNGASSGKPNLLDWFRKLCSKDASINNELRRLSRGCALRVKSYDIYEVNGHRFRSEKYEKSKGNLTTINTGVLAAGTNDANNEELEYYGIIKDIIELRFDGDSEFTLVLFDCHWFHPTNGVRHLENFGLVEVAHASCNPANEPFVLASQVTQVYYIPYACKDDRTLNAWWVAYKVRPRGILFVPTMDDYNAEDDPLSRPEFYVYQEDGLQGDLFVDLGLGLDNVTIINDLDEVCDPRELSVLNRGESTSAPRGDNGSDIPTEDSESESDTDQCPQISIEHYEEDIDDF